MDRIEIFWALLVCASLATFGLRFSFIALLRKIREPAWFRRALKYVPAAIMGALVSSSLLLRGGEIELDSTRLLAAAVAAIVGFLTRSLLWTILSGLVALFFLKQVLLAIPF